ncbi:MAG: histidine--tRNA ligase [Nitrospirota bacterium]
MLTQAIRGVKDILPSDVRKWQRIEVMARELFSAYGFSEIRIPIIEHTVLFARSIGATSDIVEKEMYSFTDQGGDQITLRPEGTASVVRSYVEHKLYADNRVNKLYYVGPMFRRERPQAGRLRQFHQIGVEALGAAEPGIDVDVLTVLDEFFKRLGINGVELQINSLGCRDCRSRYKEALIGFLNTQRDHLCEDCLRRIDINPLRALDCKSEGCKRAAADAPVMADYLDEGCRTHFEKVKEGLDDLGIKYTVKPRMVRGLDYYTRTTFEMVATDKKGAQNAVAAGGRYDGLVEEVGGPQTPGIGFAIGIERIIMMLPDAWKTGPETPALFIAALGVKARRLVQKMADDLRKIGIRTERDYAEAGLKAQMKKADKLGAKYVLIIGEDEIARGVSVLRDMRTKEQAELPLLHITESIRKIIQEAGGY